MCCVPDGRGEDVAVLVPLLLVDVAPAVKLRLGELARHREGAAVNDAGDEHNVEQGADLWLGLGLGLGLGLTNSN
eukprot:scaffold3013_cov59-Phaeocystis_antarctica.AAC.4